MKNKAHIKKEEKQRIEGMKRKITKRAEELYYFGRGRLRGKES
jgi:hypothetical protein